MMNKQQQSSFGSLVVTPCFLGVACCPSVVVTLSLVSHKPRHRGLASKFELRAKSNSILLVQTLYQILQVINSNGSAGGC